MMCDIDGCWCDNHEPKLAKTPHYPKTSANWGPTLWAKSVEDVLAWQNDHDHDKPDMIVCSPQTFAKIKEKFQTQSVIATDSWTSMFTGLSYEGIPIVADKYAPK